MNDYYKEAHDVIPSPGELAQVFAIALREKVRIHIQRAVETHNDSIAKDILLHCDDSWSLKEIAESVRAGDFIKKSPEPQEIRGTNLGAQDPLPDEKRGLYGKYKVKRTDGGSGVGKKHENCAYFVLDLVHDPHAIPAILAYAKSCEADYPDLASDLRLVYACLECKGGRHCEGQLLGCRCECRSPIPD